MPPRQLTPSDDGYARFSSMVAELQRKVQMLQERPGISGLLSEDVLASAIAAAALLPPIVNVLPASPVNGQLARYQNAAMAAEGVVWTFRYNTAGLSGMKWEFVGGPPLLSYVYPNGSPTVNPTVVGWTDSISPACVVPLTGEYITDADVMVASGTGGVSTTLMGVARQGIDTSGPSSYNGMSNLAAGTAFAIRQRTMWTAAQYGIQLAAGNIMSMQFYGFPNVTGSTWSFKGISLLPIRVAG